MYKEWRKYKLASNSVPKEPGRNDILENEISGGRFITAFGFVIVIGILKRGPRHGALQSIP